MLAHQQHLPVQSQQVPTTTTQQTFSHQQQSIQPSQSIMFPGQLQTQTLQPTAHLQHSVLPQVSSSQQPVFSSHSQGHEQIQPSTVSYTFPSSAQMVNSQEERSVDDILSERMAALLNSKKRTITVLDDHVNQYAQYGYNPQTTPTYSGTNYSYPAITQAYTITSSYQQIPSTSEHSDYLNSNNYLTPVSDGGNYTISQSQFIEPQIAYPPVYSGANASYTNYIPQYHDVGSAPAGSINSLSYSANTVNGQQGYYEVYQSTDSGISSQPYLYGSIDQKDQYTSSETSPYVSYQKTTVIDNTITTLANTYTGYNYPVSTVGNVPQVEPASNIDLLSGLDFTVNQVPLTPQPTSANNSSLENNDKNIEIKSVTETEVPVVSLKQPKEPLIEIKKPPIKLLELPQKTSLDNPEIFKIFIQELEQYEKFVDTLMIKKLNGPTNLEVKWKEIIDKQDSDIQKKSISVARCYPMKNRYPDILPYDYSRVELLTTKDDYINASHIKDITPHTPPFIVTQCPMAATITDFWTMVWEQQVELIVCLLNDKNVSSTIKLIQFY